MSKRVEHPVQPIVRAKDGVYRFKRNQIVRDLLEFAQVRGFGLNEIACREYDRNDREQLAQLIGYSVSGAGDLSYMRRSLIAAADRKVVRLIAGRRKGRS